MTITDVRPGGRIKVASRGVTPTELALKQDHSVALDEWATKARPSGTTVGTSDAQTLTNKTIAFASNTLTGVAPLASPALTGNPTTPTQAPGTSNTRIASTEYADDAADAAADAAAAAIVTSGAVADLINGPRERPGYVRSLVSSTLTGLAASRPALDVGALAYSATYGPVLQIDGEDIPGAGFLDVGVRMNLPLDALAKYVVRWAVERFEDPADPLNEGVEFRIQNLNANLGAVSNIWFKDGLNGAASGPTSAYSPTIAGGPIDTTVVISRTAADDVDYVVPASTRDITVLMRLFGSTGITYVAVLDVTEITLMLGVDSDISAETAARIADVDAEEAARIADVNAEEAARIAADDALKGRANYTAAVTTGGPTAFVTTASPTMPAVPASGMVMTVILNVDAGANPTIAIDATGALPMQKGQKGSFLFAAGELKAGPIHTFIWRGSAWHYVNWPEVFVDSRIGLGSGDIAELTDKTGPLDVQIEGGRRSGVPFARFWKDTLGHVLFGVDFASRTYARALRIGAETRRSGQRWALPILDLAGKVLAGIDQDGRFYTRTLRSGTQALRSGHRLVWPIADLAGKVFAGLDREGRFYTRAQLLGLGSNVPRLTGLPVNPLYQDLLGRILVGIDNEGAIYIRKFTSETLDAMGSGGFTDPSAWGGSYDVSNVNLYTDVETAIVREDGAAFPVRRRVVGSNTAGVLDSNLPISLDTWQGQSNAMNSGTSTETDYSRKAWPHHALMFNFGWRSTLAGVAQDPASFIDLSPVFDAAGNWQSAAVMSAFAAEGQARLAGRATGGSITYAVGQGGEPLAMFLRDDQVGVQTNVNYDGLILGAEKAAEIAALYGRTVECHFHTFVGNEAGYEGLNTAPDYAAWGPEFIDQYVGPVIDDLRTATGQGFDPKVLFWQTNMRDTALTPSGVELSMLEAGRTLAAEGTQRGWLLGPLYPYPVDPDAADEIHNTSIGRMMMGDLRAWAIRQITASRGYTPLWTTDIDITGAVITIEFASTFGAGDLMIDDGTTVEQWVKDTPDHGFSVFDDGVEATISSIAIASPNELTITLSAPPAGGSSMRIKYGAGGDEVVRDSWPSGRGNIMRVAEQRSWFYDEWERGRVTIAVMPDAPDSPKIPAKEVRLYALRFDETIIA